MTINNNKSSLIQRPAIILAMLLLAAVFLSTSCVYRKVKEVRNNAATGEAQYVIWVYDGLKLIEGFRLPINNATCQNIDSIIRKADTLIIQTKAAENCANVQGLP